MSCPRGNSICFYRGTTFSQVYTVKDSNNTAIDITNYTITFSANDSGTFSKAAVITDGPNGQATLTLTITDTASITAGVYMYQVKFADSDDNPVQIYIGALTVEDTI